MILMPEIKDNYQGTGNFAYLVLAFRTSVGDFSLDEYKKGNLEEEKILKSH
jgi:hypothetical protein